MKTITSVTTLLVIIFALIINGCSNSPSEAKTNQKQALSQDESQQGNTFTVIGIDVSGSYKKMILSVKNICKKIISNAKPGDEIYVRAISDESYTPIRQDGEDNTIVHEKFMEIKENKNSFNKKARARSINMQRLFQKQKDQMIQSIELIDLKPSPKTDIYGFIQSASDLFDNAPEGTRKVLMFATDLKDNAGFKCKPNLKGVEVTIFQFLVDADPMTSQKRRDEWNQKLKSWGADKVTFKPAN